MKCDSCDHQRVCYLYKQHISYLEHEGIQITIDKCLEFDEINKEIITNRKQIPETDLT